jgi:hypothetical protein
LKVPPISQFLDIYFDRTMLNAELHVHFIKS